VTSPETPGHPPLASPVEKRERPNLRLLLWYSIGGSLAPRYNTWVLHDVTCRTWWVRHFARVFAMITPLAVVYFVFVVPRYGAAAAYAGICVTGTVVIGGMLYVFIDTDRRAVRAGYPTNYASELRSRQAAKAQSTANYQRRERIAARKARRYGGR